MIYIHIYVIVCLKVCLVGLHKSQSLFSLHFWSHSVLWHHPHVALLRHLGLEQSKMFELCIGQDLGICHWSAREQSSRNILILFLLTSDIFWASDNKSELQGDLNFFFCGDSCIISRFTWRTENPFLGPMF